MDGRTLTFETLEHGGEFTYMMPQGIKVTDANGNWCIYEAQAIDGQIVADAAPALGRQLIKV